jgi:hypothetical protein
VKINTRQKRAGRLSNLRAPRPARLPNPKPMTIKPKDSRYERGTNGGQVRIKPCIPGRKSRGKPIKHDKRRHKRRNRIEIMFGRLKDWRRVATRYDRCPKVFLSTVALAATVMFWLWRKNEADAK